MKYRYLIYPVIFALTLLLGTGVAKAAYELHSESRFYSPDSPLTLDVNLSNDTPYYGFQFELMLPDGCSFQTDAENDVVVTQSERIKEFTLVSKVLEPNKIRVAGFSADHSAIKGDSGSILSFKIQLDNPERLTSSEVIMFTNVSFVADGDKDENLNSTFDSFSPIAEGSIYMPDFEIVTNRENPAELRMNFAYEVSFLTFDMVMPKGLRCSIDWKNPSYNYVGIAPVTYTLYKFYINNATGFISNGFITEVVFEEEEEFPVESEIILQDAYVRIPDYPLDVRLRPTVTKIKLTKPRVENITLSHTSLSLELGDRMSLEAKVTPDDAGNKEIVWKSGDSSVADVDNKGVITAMGLGKTTITATAADGSGVKAECEVAVSSVSVKSIVLNYESIQRQVGEMVTLVATVLPETAADKTVIWSSSDDTVASVDYDGNVFTKRPGDAVISATCGKITATCKIKVVPVPVRSVTLSQHSAQLMVGGHVALTAAVSPSHATDKTVEWTSSDAAVATVDAKGNVNAISPGEATIKAACGQIADTCKITVVPVPVESITLSAQTARLKAGESILLTATVLPENATFKTVVWTSSDSAVAVVDESGNVMARKPGVATITATSGAVSSACVVTVVAVTAESITLNLTTARIKIGEALTLTATVSPENTTDKTVVWTSSDDKVASVDSEGYVEAKSIGEAIITAACGAITASCAVTVLPVPVENITLSQESAQLKLGESLTLKATILPDNATDKTLTWSSSNSAIASVDANGNVTAESLGEAIITAACGEVTASCAITVVPVPVESIVLNQQNIRLTEGQSTVLTATVLPENATDKAVVWSTSDMTVAAVDQDGTVLAVTTGTATITATANDGSGIAAMATVEVVDEDIPEILEATYDFTAPDHLTPAQQVNTNNSPVCDVNNVTFMQGEIRLIASGGGTSSRLWYNKNSGIQLRAYNGATLTVQCDEEYEIAEVEFSGSQLDALAINGAVFSDSPIVTYIVNNPKNKLTFNCVTNGSHKRADISTITVRYQKVQQAPSIPAESVIINHSECELKVGEKLKLSATVSPANATDKTIAWTSSDNAVATVDDEGNVTAIALGEAIVTAACGDVKAECVVTVVPTPVERVTLNRTTASLEIGEAITLIATVQPEDATDKTIAWTSSDNAVATVDDEGNVTAIALGEATVTAACGDVKAECVVTVVPTPVERVTLNRTTASLEIGEEITLIATVQPEDATDKTIAWTSSDNAVATVDDEGNVTAIALGEATVTAACGDVKAECVVTVVPTPVERVTLNRITASLEIGEEITLIATVQPEDATDKTIAWTSSDNAVATVDSNGRITAIGVGETEITASCGSVAAICKVTVLPILIESIVIAPDVVTGNPGDYIELVAKVLPENATDKSLIWTSTDEAVASVDSDGMVQIRAVGACVIYATANDGSGVEAQCEVTGVSGIEEIVAGSEGKIDVYDLGGKLLMKGCDKACLSKLEQGLYILKRGSTVAKIMVK